jgi:hypothetical protein
MHSGKIAISLSGANVTDQRSQLAWGGNSLCPTVPASFESLQEHTGRGDEGRMAMGVIAATDLTEDQQKCQTQE